MYCNIVFKAVMHRFALRQAWELMVALVILALQLAPASAQVPLEVAVPSSKNLPSALEIVDRVNNGLFDREGGGALGGPGITADEPPASPGMLDGEDREGGGALGGPGITADEPPASPGMLDGEDREGGGVLGNSDPVANNFTKRLNRFIEENGLDPNINRKLEKAIAPVWLNDTVKRALRGSTRSGNRLGPDIGTVYDSSGRLRVWTINPSSSSGYRLLESPLMEALPKNVAEGLKKYTKGQIDWGEKQQLIATDLGDLPRVSGKPIQDQSYQERKNARMRFVTREGISLTVPSPVQIGTQVTLGGKISGEVTSPIAVTWWVDGKKAGEKTIELPGFSIPLNFATSGRHRFKVVAIDGSGRVRTRLIFIPVAFKVTTTIKNSSIGGGRLSVLVGFKGGEGPYEILWTSSDGKTFKRRTRRESSKQKFRNPDQNPLKWIDIVVTDTKTGLVVPTRVDLENIVPIEIELKTENSTLKVDENGILKFDIKGGAPEFKVRLYIDGNTARTKMTSSRSGQFSVSFEEAGTYRIAANVRGKNSVSQRQTLVLKVLEEADAEIAPMLTNGNFLGEFVGLQINLADGAEVRNGRMKFSISEGKVVGRVAGQLTFYNTVNNFSGDVTGSYDASTEKLTAKIKGRWSGPGGGGLILGQVSGMGNATGFAGRWEGENMSGVWSADPTN
jgi:hypothetical protein